MAFRGAFRVDELSGDRWQLALDRLRAGSTVVVGDVAISLADAKIVRATAASAWSDPRQISAEAAVSELRRAEAALSTMTDASEEFAAETVGRSVELQVVSDYDTGSVLVARSAGGRASWADGRALTGD